MERSDIIFQIGYSIRVEKMQATLLARIDRFINFSQILIGVAVVANASPIASGLVIAALSAVQITYQPATKSMSALFQKQKYERLQADAADLTDVVLRKQYSEIQAGDSLIMGALANSAHIAELIRLNEPVNIDLTTWEKIVAWSAGDLPKANPQVGQ